MKQVIKRLKENLNINLTSDWKDFSKYKTQERNLKGQAWKL